MRATTVAALSLLLLAAACGGSGPASPDPSSPVSASPSDLPLSPSPSASQPSKHPGPGPSDPSTAPADGPVELSISYSADGTGGEKWTLTCDPNGGTHPEVAAACAAVAKGGASAFQPVSPTQMCTQIYGGPQTATVTGTVGGTAITATFNRRNGCEIARWDRLEGLLPKAG